MMLNDSTRLRLSKLACRNPFNYIEIHTHGQISACCYSWLPIWVGNILTDTIEEIINNSERKRVQNNIQNGDFSDCNNQCVQLGSIAAGNSDYWDITEITKFDEFLKKSPVVINFSYDRSCNLQCPSCRNELIVWNANDEQDIDGQRIKKIHEQVKKLVNTLLSQDKEVVLVITGSGDPFASSLYWNYLLELTSDQNLSKNLYIQLKTNGVMMTLENLEKIKNLWSKIIYLEVSIDAATEDTYKIVRKNGNFKRLTKNLIDFDNLVENGYFPNLQWQTIMIVQNSNYTELKAYVEQQLTFKSKPKIGASLIAQWGHIDDATFKNIAIHHNNHPDRDKLIKILQDPIFQNSQVRLGNLSPFATMPLPVL